MKWKQEEIDFLSKNFDKGSRYCYETLGRSKYSVLNKAKSLNIKFGKIPLSDDIKNKIAESMKKAHLDGKHPGWTHINTDKNKRSYPEKFFIEVFSKDFFKSYLIEEKYPYGKYVIDFLLVELKLIIEIDGQQHYRNEKAIEHDTIRDSYFLNEGFKIFRIKWIDVINNAKNEINNLINFIVNIDSETIRKYEIEDLVKYKLCGCGGIIKTKDASTCTECRIINNRKIKERPDLSILLNEIEYMGYVKTGRKYGVSDNTIRKWIKTVP